MTFWWIVLAVVVIGFALAWWSSGRSTGRPGRSVDKSTVQGDALRKHGSAGSGGGGGIPGGSGF